MKKDHLKKLIAESGYDIGFGPKKSLASYDILTAFSPLIGFFSLTIGIAGLAWEPLSEKHVSFGLIVLGLLAIYTNNKEQELKKYNSSGRVLSDLLKMARKHYAKVDSTEGEEANEEDVKYLEFITEQAKEAYMTKQVFFSGIYAHYKLFYETNCDWFVEELQLTFFKDKFPAVLKFAFLALLVGLASFSVMNWII